MKRAWLLLALMVSGCGAAGASDASTRCAGADRVGNEIVGRWEGDSLLVTSDGKIEREPGFWREYDTDGSYYDSEHERAGVWAARGDEIVHYVFNESGGRSSQNTRVGICGKILFVYSGLSVYELQRVD